MSRLKNADGSLRNCIVQDGDMVTFDFAANLLQIIDNNNKVIIWLDSLVMGGAYLDFLFFDKMSFYKAMELLACAYNLIALKQLAKPNQCAVKFMGKPNET